MADIYQLCPCGCGRKMKQCASRHALQELERIEEAIEGNQRIAALEQIDRLLAAEESTLLLMLKARTQLELGDIAAAAETIAQFKAKLPGSPTLKALESIVVSHQDGSSGQALQLLLEALEHKEIADFNCLAIGLATVAQSLLAEDNPAAAGRLLSVLETGSDMLKRIHMQAVMQEREEHFLVRMARGAAPVSADDPLYAELTNVDEAIGELGWIAAERKLDELRQQHPDSAPVLRRIGALLLLRGRDKEAAELFLQIAGLETSDPDERLMAEAVAAAVKPVEGEDWYVDMLLVTYPVESLEDALEKVLSNKQFHHVNVEPRAHEEGQPPPRGVYQLLDRPVPSVDGEVTLDQVPRMLGILLTYGKQTNAPARLKLETHADNLAACEELLRVAVPQLQESEREVVGSLFKPSVALSMQLILPQEIPPENYEQVQRDARTKSLLELWPRTPHPALDGLTPAMAARDKTRRQTVAALVLLQETSRGTPEEFSLENCRKLREQLGLPHEVVPIGEIDAEGTVKLDQLVRLPIAELSDEQLANVLARLWTINPQLGLAPLDEALRRPALISDARLRLDRLCFNLAQQAKTPAAALRWAQEAVRLAELQGQSPAEYLLALLMPAILSDQGELVQRTLARLTSDHIQEPGVREALIQFFQAIGIDPSTGAPIGGQPAAPAEPPSEGLWTPGSDTGAKKGDGGLWLPD